jgi:hypothetical protein
VRLDQLRKLPEACALLAELDKPGLLSGAPATPGNVDALSEDALLAELGVSSDPTNQSDITVLRHVRSHAERQVAEEIADRTPCEDFDKFQPLFERAERELNGGVRKAIPFKGEASVEQGNFFIVGGQFAYVAEKGEEFETSSGQPDARLRLIYGNGTESNLLMRSLQKALTQDGNGRRLSEPDAGPLFGPLFGDTAEPDDIETGTIYVLAQPIQASVRVRAPDADPQDWCHRRQGRNPHRRRGEPGDLPVGPRRDRGRVQAAQPEPNQDGERLSSAVRRRTAGPDDRGSFRQAGETEGVVCRAVAGDRRGG